MSAARLGYSFQSYLAQLPLQQVKEIHISGVRWQGNSLADVHETLQEEDYQLLEHVLGQTMPSTLTLEYARDKQRLVEQIAQLRKLLKHSLLV